MGRLEILMKRFLLIVVVALLAIGIMGCVTNPNTGEREIKPEVVAKIDAVTIPAEQSIEALAPIAVAIWPPAAGILGILGLALGAWNKRKASNSYAVTESVVTTLEKWKVDNPEAWATLEAKMSKSIGIDAENIIRAIRGLPPKI